MLSKIFDTVLDFTRHYSYTNPIIGTPGGVDIINAEFDVPDYAALIAYAHTHPSGDNQEGFSWRYEGKNLLADAGFVIHQGVPLYVLTENRNFRRLSVTEAQVITTNTKKNFKLTGTLVLSDLTTREFEAGERYDLMIMYGYGMRDWRNSLKWYKPKPTSQAYKDFLEWEKRNPNGQVMGRGHSQK